MRKTFGFRIPGPLGCWAWIQAILECDTVWLVERIVTLTWIITLIRFIVCHFLGMFSVVEVEDIVLNSIFHTWSLSCWLCWCSSWFCRKPEVSEFNCCSNDSSFDTSRHCRTQNIYRLPFGHSWLGLFIGDGSCRWMWVNTHHWVMTPSTFRYC